MGAVRDLSPRLESGTGWANQELLERPALAHLLVLGAIQRVDLLLQPVAVELHSRAGRSAYAFSAPIPTPYRTTTIPTSSDVDGEMT